MDVLTKQTATDDQWDNIKFCINCYVDALKEILYEIEKAEIPVSIMIKSVLGMGVAAGAIGKFENLKIENDVITFDAWIRVIYNSSNSYHYFVHCWMNTDTKEIRITDE